MEFFKVVNVQASEKEIQEKLTLNNLEFFCESIFPLNEGDELCPNALAWTINRDKKQEEFVEEIHQFLLDMEEGLCSFLNGESFKS